MKALASSTVHMLQRHEFQETINEDVVFFEIVELTNSFYVWMGTETSLMKSLTAAFPVQSVPLHVTSTKLFGPNDVSEQLAERLALKYRCPFFISIGLDAQATEAFHLIEKKLFELLDSIRADNRVGKE
ncbi:uncharacterized protein Gasu_10480 [Galdieria sulphuraria]|uniref:Proteasome assembly chaperone 4 n=1 Tax=Galdieria sulphuraria TaxID=130081 RepID=M2X599_GALSU|nr:uncharacterized protein Gasu_10480 [Galdieria sulphuraria]EME31665.1 hypothetical protein Gasu_10480 [Galdieria sulphuraria]|eukprot:XP_005708185.1 hypothetical protein Gasu_10480 [Galdieria sulphuraria]